MARKNTRTYSLKAVETYLAKLDHGDGIQLDVIEGALLDDLIIWHGGETYEVFEAVYVNEWSSTYVRHIYRHGLPQEWIDALDAELDRLDAEDAA